MPFIFALLISMLLSMGLIFGINSIFAYSKMAHTHTRIMPPELGSINNIYKTEICLWNQQNICIIFFFIHFCCRCCTNRNPNNLWMCHKNLMNTIIHPYACVWCAFIPVPSNAIRCMCAVFAIQIFNSYSYITHFIHLVICEALESVLLRPLPPLILFRDAL